MRSRIYAAIGTPLGWERTRRWRHAAVTVLVAALASWLPLGPSTVALAAHGAATLQGSRAGDPGAGYPIRLAAATATIAVGSPASGSPRQALATAYTTAGAGAAALIAVAYARAQLGLPYQWGGNGPANGDRGFDCSGLTTAAYAAAAISIPRTAQTQYDAGPLVAPSVAPEPGDLVLYGTPRRVHHVGLYVGGGQMINAPTFGQPVRIAPYRWNGDDYLAATRPTADSTQARGGQRPQQTTFSGTSPARGRKASPGPNTLSRPDSPPPSPTPVPSNSPAPSGSPSPRPSPSPTRREPAPAASSSPACPAPPLAVLCVDILNLGPADICLARSECRAVAT